MHRLTKAEIPTTDPCKLVEAVRRECKLTIDICPHVAKAMPRTATMLHALADALLVFVDSARFDASYFGKDNHNTAQRMITTEDIRAAARALLANGVVLEVKDE